MYTKTVITVVIILIIIGGGWLGYQWYSTNQILSTASTEQSQNTTNTQSASSVSNKIVSTSTPNVTVPTKVTSVTQINPSSVASVQNCGAVISTDLYTQSGNNSMSAQEGTSLKCASQAFLSCSPATFAFTGADGGSYKITGQSGSYCPITQKVDTSSSMKTCNIPMSFITEIAQAALKVNQTDKVFATVPLLFSGAPMTDTQTGQNITINCSSN
jgi:hypothetical protein